MKKIIINSYTPPGLIEYPDDALIVVAFIVIMLLMPVVFVCALMWGQQ